MDNRSMHTALRARTALSVLTEGHQVDSSTYQLRRYVDGKDYCDPIRELWIWSIGKSMFDGRIMAATDARYYQDPSWECLFLR